jgi:hypothetical protein
MQIIKNKNMNEKYTHFSIDRYHRSQWWKRNRFIVYGFIVLAIIALAIAYYNHALAMDYPAIHKCIETAKYLNQIATVHLDVAGCINHPNTIQ